MKTLVPIADRSLLWNNKRASGRTIELRAEFIDIFSLKITKIRIILVRSARNLAQAASFTNSSFSGARGVHSSLLLLLSLFLLDLPTA